MGMDKAQGKDSCEVCGKEQETYFEVHLGGERHVFDSFECAMDGLIPRCRMCNVIILGDGVRLENALYCGDSCAGLSEVHEYEFHLLLREQPKL